MKHTGRDAPMWSLLSAVPIIILLGILVGLVVTGVASMLISSIDTVVVLLAALRSIGMVAVSVSIAFSVGLASAVASSELECGTFGVVADRILSAMASLPSIVFAMALAPLMLTGLEIPGFLAASLVLAVATIPFVHVTCREALSTVPRTTREAAVALGGSPWQSFRQVIFPASLPFLATGWILTVARLVGEAAILVAIASLLSTPTVAASRDSVTSLPLLLVEELGVATVDFGTAAAALTILVVFVLALNGSAIYLRSFRSSP